MVNELHRDAGELLSFLLLVDDVLANVNSHPTDLRKLGDAVSSSQYPILANDRTTANVSVFY